MTTDGNLTGSDKVQRLQHILHAKAKENPKLETFSLGDILLFTERVTCA